MQDQRMKDRMLTALEAVFAIPFFLAPVVIVLVVVGAILSVFGWSW